MIAPLSGTILFQGDSITDAFRRPDELNDAYRLGNGYAFLIGSYLRATAQPTAPSLQNRGVAGNTSRDLLSRWHRDIAELQPTTLSILIGVNNAIQACSGGPAAVETFAPAFDSLVSQLSEFLPQTHLILLEPFSLQVPGGVAGLQNQLEPVQAHIRSAAADCGATLVSLQKSFDEVSTGCPSYWLYDGIHPTAAGHYLIAHHWLATVTGSILPTPFHKARI